MSLADRMTRETKRLRWSLSPPLWVLDAYSLLMDTARIRLASAFTSMAVDVALIVPQLCAITHCTFGTFSGCALNGPTGLESGVREQVPLGSRDVHAEK